MGSVPAAVLATLEEDLLGSTTATGETWKQLLPLKLELTARSQPAGARTMEAAMLGTAC